MNTTTTSKRTSLPWQRAGNLIVASSTGETIAIMHWQGDVEREANAELVVHATNCHEELIKALENTLSMLTLLNAPGMNDPIEARVYQARDVLARAKEDQS